MPLTPKGLKPWNPAFVRIHGTFALLLPILGAALYHVDGLSEIGQQRFFVSFGRSLVIISLLSMMFMPQAFRSILDSRQRLDEYQIYWRSRAFHLAYRLIVLTVLVMIAAAGIAAEQGLGGVEMRSFLVTIFEMVVAYALIIPFNILAWSIGPPVED